MKSKGFNVLELIVVVTIIGILATIAIPNFKKFKERTQQREQQSANWDCTPESKTWTRECAKTTNLHDCKYRAAELFCKNQF